VESSVSADVRNTPIRGSDSAGPAQTSTTGRIGEVRRANPNDAATDPVDAAKQEQVRADHDALQASADRVDASLAAGVRDTPIQHTDASSRASEDTTEVTRNGDLARANADAARDSAARVDRSVADDRNRR
jgi:hypothetical protein